MQHAASSSSCRIVPLSWNMQQVPVSIHAECSCSCSLFLHHTACRMFKNMQHVPVPTSSSMQNAQQHAAFSYSCSCSMQNGSMRVHVMQKYGWIHAACSKCSYFRQMFPIHEACRILSNWKTAAGAPTPSRCCRVILKYRYTYTLEVAGYFGNKGKAKHNLSFKNLIKCMSMRVFLAYTS